MKKILKLIILAVMLQLPSTSMAAFNISPNSQEEFINILKGLANDHSYKQWCQDNCGQIHLLKLSGRIADGELDLDISGNIVGKDNGVLPLFGSVPAVEIISLKNGSDEVPLVFYNKSYYTLLAPGPFQLKGKIKIDRTSSTNFTLPGAIGKVLLDISDQEPLLKSVRLGQIGGSFQIVSASQKKDKGVKSQKRDLRLDITRDFVIARDKTFTYTIKVVGAKVGQVITFPLSYDEKVLLVNPQNAKISSDRVEFTATGSDNRFVIQGEWTKKDVKLIAAAGAVKETWGISCEGAYDCLFSGDVEKAVGTSGHQWIPLAGQILTVTWKELGLLQGQSIVAQEVLLDSRYTGKGMKQKLVVKLTSSAADQIFIDLPDTAIPTELKYGSKPSPILKNKKGLVHLTVPQGDSQISLSWEIPKRTQKRIPLPEFKLPTGKWIFWVTPNKNENAIYTGGPAGSPVVLFWPRMGFCLFMGLLFIYTERKLFKKSQTSLVLFLILCAGYALSSPLSILAVVGFIAAIRLLGRVKEKRTIFGWLFEGGIVLLLAALTIGTYIALLDKAFFTGIPFSYESFCSSASVAGNYKPLSALCWESTLVRADQPVSSPYIITLPTLVVRVVYFFWAVVVGYYFFRELKNLWQGLKHYYSLGRKPVFKKKLIKA